MAIVGGILALVVAGVLFERTGSLAGPSSSGSWVVLFLWSLRDD
jgi:hypothetical protein